MKYLLFTRFLDERTGEICVPSDLVKQIGETATAIHFLNEFSAAVLPLAYSAEWSYSAGQCRTLKGFDWPVAVQEARDDEVRRRWRRDERVYLRTGLRVTPRQRQRQLAALEAAVMTYAENATEAQQKVMAYLHSRSSNQYTAIVMKNRDAAFAEADKIEDREARYQAHMTIRSLLDQPKPFYRPSGKGKTTRLFPLGDSLATLPSPIRRALLGDWYELDLKGAQFAIAARLWNIDLINDFLRSGSDVWSELISYFGGRVEKWFLKERVYQVINGGSKRCTKEMLDWVVGEGAGNRFFAHPFIEALWAGRRRAFASIWTFAKILLEAPIRTRVLVSVGRVYGFLKRLNRLEPRPRAAVSGSNFTASQSHAPKFAKVQFHLGTPRRSRRLRGQD